MLNTPAETAEFDQALAEVNELLDMFISVHHEAMDPQQQNLPAFLLAVSIKIRTATDKDNIATALAVAIHRIAELQKHIKDND